MNLVGAVRLRARLPPRDARARERALVTIGSIADRAIFPGNAAYSASKYGLRALHEVLRAELRGSGVRATLVSPGPVDTELWDPIDPDNRPGFTPRAQMLARGRRRRRDALGARRARQRQRRRAAPLAQLRVGERACSSSSWTRCAVRAPHEESWLVARRARIEARHVAARARSAAPCVAPSIRSTTAIVDFRAMRRDAVARADAATSTRPPARSPRRDARTSATRSGFAVLIGAWGARADELRRARSSAAAAARRSAGGHRRWATDCRASARGATLPLAAGAARAVATDDGRSARASPTPRA